MPHTGEQTRLGVVVILFISAVMRRNPFGEGERRIADTHFVGELLRFVVGVIASFRRACESRRQRSHLVGNLRDARMGDQQQSEKNDDHENRNRKTFGKPPCQRTSQHIAEQPSGALQQSHVERRGIGGDGGIENRADRP